MTTSVAPKLWQIGTEYEAIVDTIVASGGVLTPELEAELDAIGIQFEYKAANVALFIRNLETWADQAASEAKRLEELATVRTNTAKSLKGYLLRQMQRIGKDKIENGLVSLRIQKNGGQPTIAWSAEIETLPAPYRTEKVVYGIDREKVVADHTAGLPLPAGLTCERGVHLRLR